MDTDSEWSSVLGGHPIFSLPKKLGESADDLRSSLELSTKTLSQFAHVDPEEDGLAPTGRRQVMILKDADLILAAGNEIRITSLNDSKLTRNATKTYKTLHTPNIQFEIHQLALNPSRKLLAIAGAFQVAVVVLPRSGFNKLVTSTVDCRSIQVGQFYHATSSSAPIAKIDWHPWGEAGSTLMVMTTDGKLREYDISVDPDEPTQVLLFSPEKKSKSFIAEDASEREVASFTLGKGKADWGPLTVYAVMKSGDIYAICPYMPHNASIPSSYIHALECFIAAKQEFISQGTSTMTKSLSTLYDYQRKYVNALVKQLPPGTMFPATSRSVSMHPPSTVKNVPVRQGPFLLQPAPRIIPESEGGDATDIVYLAFGKDYDEESEGETERLGVLMITFQDGKVDICLDVEKVEARWEHKQDPTRDLPMLSVYETIDLGIISMLKQVSTHVSDPSTLDLVLGNHAVFHLDPIHDDTIYVYHAFGVHALHLGSLLQNICAALHVEGESDESFNSALQKVGETLVQPILTTFSVERRCSNPVIAIAVPNDVYLTYSIFILTSTMRIISFSLNLRPESPEPRQKLPPTDDKVIQPTPLAIEGPPAYVSLLGKEPFVPSPVLSRPSGLPLNPRLALPQQPAKSEFMLTPDTLRSLGKTVEAFTTQIHDVQLAYRYADTRSELQKQEFKRQQDKTRELWETIQKLRGTRHHHTQDRLKRVQDHQKSILGRMDRILQGLMEKASPELSEHETKWFEELRRMKQEIIGTGRYDEGSLQARASLLRREYDRLLPSLKEMSDKEERRKNKLAEIPQGLGVSQAFELGERSNNERARIIDIEQKLLKLASKLDLSLGRPPTRQEVILDTHENGQ